ncbi:hypothetical protein B0H10DRAFT_1964942 [Mycena sp. CBHHK59/15]|nr:hypothetical protein B0H10DRAFT_1964942 [Mycena sp. CBHHK59/15]
MDEAPHANAELASEWRDTGSVMYSGSMLSGSHHFAVSNGTFTNITRKYCSIAPPAPSGKPFQHRMANPTTHDKYSFGLRVILFGDIDLRYRTSPIRTVGTADVLRKSSRRKVDGGDVPRGGSRAGAIHPFFPIPGPVPLLNSVQEWQQDIARYMSIRQVF